jgi:hypothetical protein
MNVRGNYSSDGYALVEGLIPADLTKALLDSILADVRDEKLPFSFTQKGPFLTKPAMELHGNRHAPLKAFHWGLTPLASMFTQCELLPTYCFFRLYQEGDRLRVHSDRDACEHSLSLTLGYSDGKSWGLDVAKAAVADAPDVADDFGNEAYSTLTMQPGDAVLYRGIALRHGRVTPNPNRWAAQFFLHWVDSAGRYRDLAFEDPDRAHA